jgi:ATP-dependent Clp protease adaptor protein ClpS
MSDWSESAEPADEETVVTVKPHPKQKRQHKAVDDTRRKRQPPYVVIVENDDFHTYEYVIEVLQRICGHDELQAFVLADEIHHSGRAAVWSGTLELAELKRDQIRGFGPDCYAREAVKFPLGAYIEPLPGD